MDVEYKVANLEDFKKIVEIQKNDGFEHSYYLTKERYIKLLERGEHFVLMYVGDEPIAFASYDPEIRAKLHFLSVNKDHQGKGYGKEILYKLLSEIGEQGYDRTYTYVEKGSPEESFLMHQGFEMVGDYKNRYGSGKDATILEKDLIE